MNVFFAGVLVTVTEMFLVSLPQNSANIIFMYAFSKKKIEAKNFWMAMLISIAAIFWIRRLPISFGIPSILSMIFLIVLGVYFLKFPIRKTILAVFFSFIFTALIEIADMKTLTAILGESRFNEIMNNNLTYTLAGIPASLFLLAISSVVYLLFKRQNIRSTDNGKTSEANS